MLKNCFSRCGSHSSNFLALSLWRTTTTSLHSLTTSNFGHFRLLSTNSRSFNIRFHILDSTIDLQNFLFIFNLLTALTNAFGCNTCTWPIFISHFLDFQRGWMV